MKDSTLQAHVLDYSEIADIEVGYISIVKSKSIESVQSFNNYLSDIKNGKYKDAVESYRTIINGKMPIELKCEAVRKYKTSVPCCVPHSCCTTLPISNSLPQNGFMQVDIDFPSLGNLYVSKEQIIAALEACPYIFAYHKSIGGEGYVGYAYSKDSINQSFWVVAEDMQRRGLHVDLSKGVGTGEKRFMSYDSDLVIKEQFMPIQAISGLNKESIVKEHIWHKPSIKRLVKDTEKAFANWVAKNGGFDWTSTGPAAPAGLLANAVSQHQHILNPAELMQLADWCVYLYNDEFIVEKDRAVWEQYLSRYGKVTQSNSGCNTQSNTGETAQILESNGIFVTSVTFFNENKSKSDTHRVMLLDRGKQIITKSFRNQSNKSLLLRVVGGEKHYLTLYLQGDAQFEWHSKTSVTSVDGKVTNWLKSFKSEDSYTYIRDDNPANLNEWEIDLGYRTIIHNTMSTPRFRTTTYKDEVEVTEEDCRWYWQQMKENRDGKYGGDWDYLENSLAYMVQGLYRKHGRPCTILIADEGGTAKKDLSVAIWNIIAGVTRNSLDKLEIGKPGCVALFQSSIVIADESEDLTKADLGVLKNICDATFDTKRSLYSNEETAEIRSLLIVMTNTLKIPLNRSYIRKFAYLGAGESKGGSNAEFNTEDEARFKRLSLSPRVHEYWYDHLMALKVDVYKATTKYGTERLQEDNMDDLLEELRLIEAGRADFFCVDKNDTKYRVRNGATFRQIELKKYLLSLPDKTLLNGKKDIVKVLRGYIDRGQINWTINERSSNLKDGTIKKQPMSITVHAFPSCENADHQVILPFRVPDSQSQTVSAAQPLAAQPANLLEWAEMIHNSGRCNVSFDEILSYFGDDHVKASGFLQDNDLEVRLSLDGQYITST
jgi:hypothetical protein